MQSSQRKNFLAALLALAMSPAIRAEVARVEIVSR